MIERLRLFRMAARVQRCHIMPTNYRQSVGEHTFGLIALIYLIEDDVSSNLVKAALFHDITEAETGDTPATAKWETKELEEGLRIAEKKLRALHDLEIDLTVHEQGILKFCDLMELAIFSLEEADDGKSTMAIVCWNALEAIKKRGLVDVAPRAFNLFDMVKLMLETRHSYVLHGHTGYTHAKPKFS